MSYLLRPAAETDLDDIWNFTANRWTDDQANRYYRQLIDAFERLAGAPALGRSCDEIRSGYRRYNVEAHVVFYRIVGDDVEIVRILHARRDFRLHLPKV